MSRVRRDAAMSHILILNVGLLAYSVVLLL